MARVPAWLAAVAVLVSDYDFWIGLFVPAETQRDIVDRLYRETAQALEKPAVIAWPA
jgi:tripartite-type tricarboxylate transporter receptor subunit TctC